MMPPWLLLAFDWQLQPVQAPVDAPFLPASVCADCHPQEVADWRGSGHAQAWTSPLFQAGFAKEPASPCVFCHAPLREQTAEVLANHDWYEARHQGQILLPPRRPEPKASEGVTCAVCHVRGGVVATAAPVEGAAHPTEAAPGLTNGALCQPCHEFPMVDQVNGQSRVRETPMQSTVTEWRQSGSAQSCVGCHMPQGSHGLRGRQDLDWLRASVRIAVSPTGFVLWTEGIGHDFPTGDVFRHLRLEVDGETVAWLGRRFVLDDRGPEPTLREVEDSRLRAGERRPIPFSGADTRCWRLIYGLISEEERHTGRVSADQQQIALHSGGCLP